MLRFFRIYLVNPINSWPEFLTGSKVLSVNCFRFSQHLVVQIIVLKAGTDKKNTLVGSADRNQQASKRKIKRTVIIASEQATVGCTVTIQ